MKQAILIFGRIADHLTKNDTVSARCHDAEFTYFPRFIFERREYVGAAFDKISVELVNIFDDNVCKPRVAAGVAGVHVVRTFAKHYLEFAEREELPTRRPEITLETELVEVIGGLDSQVFHRKDVPRSCGFSVDVISFPETLVFLFRDRISALSKDRRQLQG